MEKWNFCKMRCRFHVPNHRGGWMAAQKELAIHEKKVERGEAQSEPGRAWCQQMPKTMPKLDTPDHLPSFSLKYKETDTS